MYKITADIADYLLTTRKDPQIPGLVKDEFQPFVQRNTHTIGFITPVLVSESDSKFLVELQVPYADTSEEATRISEDTTLHQWWIYRRSELKRPIEPINVQRNLVDKYYEKTGEIDLSDCAIQLPEDHVRESSLQIQTLIQLAEIFPDIQDCLDPNKENMYVRHDRIL